MAAPSPHRRRAPLRRRILIAAVLVAFGAAVGLVSLELYLRATTPSALAIIAELRGMFRVEADGTVLTTPGWTGQQMVEGRKTEVRLNRLGMRGPDVEPRKPNGQRRILVLGDSFVWGYGVAEDETLCARLEELLRADGADVRVGNAGAPSYGPRKSLAALRRIRDDFDPDVVVVCIYVGNDFDDDVRTHETVIDGHRVDGPMARHIESSWRARNALRFRTAFLVERWLDEHLPALAMDRTALALDAADVAATAILPPPAQRVDGLFMDRRTSDRHVEAVLASLRATFTSLADVARPASMLAVVLPTATHCLPGRYERRLRAQGLDPSAHERGLVGRRIGVALAEVGVRTVDLCRPFIGSADPRSDWQAIGLHLSIAGNRRAAEWVAPAVRELLDERR